LFSDNNFIDFNKRGNMRLDKFLKVSRLIKRRTVAQDACDADRVSVNGKAAKPSHTLKEGDIITIGFGDKSFSVRVLSLKESVKKEEIQSMYEAVN
jgi:ribosomal 50S subunit-recycling heat shock protein